MPTNKISKRAVANAHKLKADPTLKFYWGNEEFADIFNAVVFKGKQVISPEDLDPWDTSTSTIIEGKMVAESLEGARDITRIVRRSKSLGVTLAIVGLENQSHIHYLMPLRTMEYDAYTYKKQYDMLADMYKRMPGDTDDEYLSKVRRGTKLDMVLTIVIYYGVTPWDGPRTLRDMVNVPEELEEYFNDYNMFLVEVARDTLVLDNENNVDLFQMIKMNAEFNRLGMKPQSRRNMIKNYVNDTHVDKKVVQAFASLYKKEISDDILKGGTAGDMVDNLFDETTYEEGLIKGKAEMIIEMSQEAGMNKEDILSRLMQKLNISLQTAQEYFGAYSNNPV